MKKKTKKKTTAKQRVKKVMRMNEQSGKKPAE